MTNDLPSPAQSLARPLYRLAEVRAIERAAAAALPAGALMERAGKAAAALALELLRAERAPAAARVLVLAGPGNNGGDALEAAAHLAHAGCRVTVLHAGPGAAVSAERTAALARAQASTARFIDGSEPGHDYADIHEDGTWQLVIDGLFGIGLARPVTGALRQVVASVNALAGRCPVLALDVPSGLDADTGAVVGPDGVAIMASHTLTFIADKPGLHTNAGRDYAGHVTVAPLDIDHALLPPAQLHLNAPGLFAACLHPRPHASHKGSYGSVAVIGGASGMTGAPLLAARTALHSGAGRVYVLFPDAPLAADAGQPELMCRSADGYDLELATLVIGPGLGAASSAGALLARALASGSALVADADALNLLASQQALRGALAGRAAHGKAERERAYAVLTPHPLEAARLLGVGVAQVQADRIAAARALAAQYGAVVVLKGSGTVIAAPDGHCVINPTGNPALATAGTGDVLAGLCGSLLAQGCPPWQAALAAVWLHGAAADALVAGGVGPIGLTAGELVPAIRAGLNALVRDQSLMGLS